MPRNFFALAVVAALPAIASAEPPRCQKWHTDTLTACEALGLGLNCTLDGRQLDQANGTLYQDDPVTLCKKIFTKSSNTLPGYNSSKVVKACKFGATNACLSLGATDRSAYCVFDINNDTFIDWNDATSIGTMIQFENVTPDPHCFCTPNHNNPHAGVTWSGYVNRFEERAVFERYNFPSALKKAVAQENLNTTSGLYRSDGTVVNTTQLTVEPRTLQKVNKLGTDAAEVDHIMPRVDSHGCLCGAPVPENAALISRALNGEMSNTSPQWDYWRSKMYDAYMTCPDPEAVRYKGPKPPIEQAPDGSQADEPIDTVSTLFIADTPEDEDLTNDGDDPSGCSAAAGGAGFAAIGIALVGLIRRRRVRR